MKRNEAKTEKEMRQGQKRQQEMIARVRKTSEARKKKQQKKLKKENKAEGKRNNLKKTEK